MFNWLPIALMSPCPIAWIGASSQFKCCANDMKHDLNCLVADGVTTTGMGLVDKLGKSHKGLDGIGRDLLAEMGIKVS